MQNKLLGSEDCKKKHTIKKYVKHGRVGEVKNKLAQRFLHLEGHLFVL